MIEKATSCRGLVVQNDKVLLIRRHKDNVDYWVFPGGHTENEEAPSEVASREILEETGLNVTEVGEVIFYDHPKWGTHEAVVICQVSPGEPVLGGPETERNSPEDLYEPSWVDVELALTFENLFPDPVRELFRNRFSRKSDKDL